MKYTKNQVVMDSSIKAIFVITIVFGFSMQYIHYTTSEQNYQKINSIAYTTLIEDLNPETVLEGKQYLNITDFSDVYFVEYQRFKSFFSWEENKTIIYSGSNLVFLDTEDIQYYGYQFKINRKHRTVFREYEWMNPINQEIVEIE